MPKTEACILCRQFIEELPDAKPSFTHRGVVQEHHGAAAELGQPGFEIVAYRFVGMQSIDVQEVNAAVFKLACCVIETRTQQLREILV